MYVQTAEGPEQLQMPYLYHPSIGRIGEHSIGQPVAASACLSALKCVPHQHVPRTCGADGSFISATSPRVMERAAMNPGFFRATDGFHEFDVPLHMKLQNLLLDTPKYAAMLSDQSRRTRDASPADSVRVALVDLTGDKLCKPGYADWGSKFPTIAGSTMKIAILYATHQLLYDLNEMARTSGSTTAAALKKKADEVWSPFVCPPDLDWLVAYDLSGPTVRVKASNNLALHLRQMVDGAFPDASVARSNQLIMRLGFEYIASVLWQSGLRRSRDEGLWIRNTYAQAKVLAKVNPNCHYKIHEKSLERIVWFQDPTNDTGLRLTALSVVTFLTLLAQRRLVNDQVSVAMESLLRKGCTYPLQSGYYPSFPVRDMNIRASKCGLTSEVMHVAMLLESRSRDRRYALAVLCLRQGHSEGKVMAFLNSIVKDIDKLVKANNP